MSFDKERRPMKWPQENTPRNRRVNGFVKHGALLSAALLLLWGPPATFGGISLQTERESNRKTETTSRIQTVLLERIEDPEVLAMTEDKLFTLGDEEIRLISSLCSRISAGERTARADVVFSLVTTLIVLS